MASIRRSRLAGEQNPFCKRRLAEGLSTEVSVPSNFRCPISLDLMKDPVTASTGITFDRQSIEAWLDMGNSTCPVTKQELRDKELIPNHTIRRMIQDWCVANRSYGVERIPTPRIPLSPAQASELVSEMAFASRIGDRARCSELAAKIMQLGKESERNRRCLVLAGAARALAASFAHKASKEILSALLGFLPLDEEACRHIGSPEALNSVVSMVRSGDLAGRLNAVLVLREVLACNKELANVAARAEGLIEVLVKLIKEPVSSNTTKASLVAVYYLATSSQRTASRLAEMGVVTALIDILIDSDKSVCEKALAVFDGVCNSEKGREEARGHALVVPVLVKKMFRVSDMATELAVSALWKLCKRDGGEGARGSLVEAMQVGAFQKLLLLLQLGCSEATKERATELLKMLNGFNGRLDCVDASDLRGVKRPF